ncbi:WD40-repeat-containing domain protein [Trichoderma novae-zelandiae]
MTRALADQDRPKKLKVASSTKADAAAAAEAAGNAVDDEVSSPAPAGIVSVGFGASVDGNPISPASLGTNGLSDRAFRDDISNWNRNVGSQSPHRSFPFDAGSDSAALWDTAYSRLQRTSGVLLDLYGRVIDQYLAEKYLEDESEYRPTSIAASMEEDSLRLGLVTRRGRMDRVVRVWLREHDDDMSSDETLIGEAHRCLRDLLQSSRERSSYASLPWAVACLFVERVSRHESLSEVTRWCIIEVISKMEWYLGLSILIFDRRTDDPSEPYFSSLKEKTIRLYETILLFTIQQSVASASPRHWREPSDYFDSTKRRVLEREEALVSELKGLEIFSRLHQLPDHARSSRESSDTDSEIPEALKDRLDDLRAKLQPIEPLPSEATFGNGYILPLLYSWARNTEEYRSFLSREPDDLEEHGCRVLWVTGPPGSGKTMLMRATVQGLLDERGTVSSTDKFNLAYFFCDGRDQPHGYVTQAIKSLIWQIIKSQPSLVTHMEDKFRSTDRETLNDPNDFYAISTVLYSMIDESHKGGSKFGLTYIIVDAIEELCINDGSESALHSGPSMDDLMQLINKTSKISPNIKWLVSVSAQHDQASVGLAPDGMIRQMTLKMDDERYSPALGQDVIKEYISFEVAEVASQAGFKDPFQSQVKAKFSAAAPRNFLWVKMACRRIALHGLPWNATAILDKLPENVERLYHEDYRAIDAFDSEEDRTMCHDILSTTAITYRTLRKSELGSLVKLPSYMDIDIVVTKMCSFLSFHANNVCYVHPSARDFVRNALVKDDAISARHLKLTELCLEQAIARNKPKSDTYAITNWIRHLCAISNYERLNCAIQVVNRFFNDHFLEWAEILATQGLLPEAAVLLQRLNKFLRSTEPSDRTESHVHCIMNTQQVLWLLNFRQSVKSLENLSPKYSLPFLPNDSELRQKLLRKAFPWLEVVPNIDPNAALSGAVHILEDHRDWVRCCCYSPDGRLIASGGDDGWVRFWDAETLKVQHTFYAGGYVTRVLFILDQLLVAFSGSSIHIWDSSTDAHLSPDGKQLVASRDDAAYIFQRPSDPTENWVESKMDMIYDPGHSIGAIRFSPDGALMAYTQDSKIFLWDLENDKARHLLPGHTESIDGLAFSHNSEYLASGSDDRTVRIWAISNETGENSEVDMSLCVLEGHEDYVNCVAFSPDDARLASGSSDLTIRIWARKGSEAGPHYGLEKVLRGHGSSIYSLDFDPSGQQLISSSSDTSLRVWDISTPQNAEASHNEGREPLALPPVKGHSTTISVVVFSPDGRLFSSASSDGKICLWECDKGDVICSFMGHELQITSLDFSHDGSVLVSASRDWTARVWDTNRQVIRHRLRGHSDWVRCAVVSPDGKLVASASDDRSVRVWDISSLPLAENANDSDAEHRLLQGENGHSDYVFAVTFSPKGGYLASGGDDLQILVWNLEMGDGNQDEPWITIGSASEDSIRGLAYTEDETRLVSCEVGGVVRIWNLETRLCEQILTPEGQPQLFKPIQFKQNYLVTEIGAWSISIEAPPSSGSVSKPDKNPAKATLVRTKLPKWGRYGISNNRDWITWDNKELIFLPTQYRSRNTDQVTCGVQDRMVVIGCDSGQVLFFKFSEQGPYSQ